MVNKNQAPQRWIAGVLAISIGGYAYGAYRDNESADRSAQAAVPSFTDFIKHVEAADIPYNNQINAAGVSDVVTLRDGRKVTFDIYGGKKGSLPAPDKASQVEVAVYPAGTDIHQPEPIPEYDFLFTRGASNEQRICCPLPGILATGSYNPTLASPNYEPKSAAANNGGFIEANNYSVHTEKPGEDFQDAHVSQARGRFVLHQLENQALLIIKTAQLDHRLPDIASIHP